MKAKLLTSERKCRCKKQEFYTICSDKIYYIHNILCIPTHKTCILSGVLWYLQQTMKGILIMNGEMSYKQGKYSKLIDRFADSGYKICEVTFEKDEKGGKEDSTIVYCINQATKRFSKPHIYATKRNDKIYLLNTMLCK